MAESYTYYAFKECGCLAWAAIDVPRNAKEIARQTRISVSRGEAVFRQNTEEFRQLPWSCKAHRKEQHGDIS